MGKKTLTNAHCLLDLIEKAPIQTLKAFSGLPECQALTRESSPKSAVNSLRFSQ